ncbi:hypothetical protein BP5796_11913 [Coleophoma crateriformis]|uniref:Uncharacterized protein n=1 Tax=Coleophoma crateriformis TaxID=565419 RepID=A0A3D8QF05_9HELO|nr:hypothetical protein BP5796_11913 [Coleophoma crateriformis]
MPIKFIRWSLVDTTLNDCLGCQGDYCPRKSKMRVPWKTALACATLFTSIKATTSAIPDCSLDCLGTIVPEICGSLTNVTCLCTNAAVMAELTPCVSAACNITESFRLEKYQADTCGVPTDRTRVEEQFHLLFVMPVIAFLFVAARVLSRSLLDLGIAADDYMMIAALISYFADVGTGLVICVNGFGEHTYSLTIAQISESLKLPFHGNWTNWMYKVAPVKCINSYAAIFVAAALSITHDLIILAMPLPVLWQLHLPWQKKANLLIMFSVGSFVIVCSLIRLPSLLKLQSSADPSYDQAPIAVWTDLEQSIGIICGCLPACRSLVGYLFPGLQMSLQGTSDKSSSYGLGYSKRSTTTSRPDHLDRDRNFIEIEDQLSRENSDRRRAESVKSQESQIPLSNILVPAEGKNMGHRTYVGAVEAPRKKSREFHRGLSTSKSTKSLPNEDGGIMLTRSVLLTEQLSGSRR